jgi:hypothetical protein
VPVFLHWRGIWGGIDEKQGSIDGRKNTISSKMRDEVNYPVLTIIN